jgi:hypothetical protein
MAQKQLNSAALKRLKSDRSEPGGPAFLGKMFRKGHCSECGRSIMRPALPNAASLSRRREKCTDCSYEARMAQIRDCRLRKMSDKKRTDVED